MKEVLHYLYIDIVNKMSHKNHSFYWFRRYKIDFEDTLTINIYENMRVKVSSLNASNDINLSRFTFMSLISFCCCRNARFQNDKANGIFTVDNTVDLK